MVHLDTLDKYIKVVRAASQSLWHAILEVRAGTQKREHADQIAAILKSTLQVGDGQCYSLPEIDQWWSREVLEAFDRLD